MTKHKKGFLISLLLGYVAIACLGLYGLKELRDSLKVKEFQQDAAQNILLVQEELHLIEHNSQLLAGMLKHYQPSKRGFAHLLGPLFLNHPGFEQISWLPADGSAIRFPAEVELVAHFKAGTQALLNGKLSVIQTKDRLVAVQPVYTGTRWQPVPKGMLVTQYNIQKLLEHAQQSFEPLTQIKLGKELDKSYLVYEQSIPVGNRELQLSVLRPKSAQAEFDWLLWMGAGILLLIFALLCGLVYWANLLDKIALHFKQARHDQLTGLPNRFAYEEQGQRMLELAKRKSHAVALMYLDLNEFKPVNDTYGHQTGDALLKAVATILKGNTRASDFVARLGGDEFVIVLGDASAQEPVSLARKLEAIFQTPLQVGTLKLPISISIGLALYPEDGSTITALENKADQKMYKAKQQASRGKLSQEAVTKSDQQKSKRQQA